MKYELRLVLAIALLWITLLVVFALYRAPDLAVGAIVAPMSTVIVLLGLRYPERWVTRYRIKWLGPLMFLAIMTLYVIGTAWGEAHFGRHVDWGPVLLECTLFIGTILKVQESFPTAKSSSTESHEPK